MRQTDVQSPYFRLAAVRDGVYAAIAEPGVGAWGNAGIVDLGAETLVIDCFASPVAAADLLAAAIKLTGREPRYVVHTHAHGDHILGNEVFAKAVVIATDETRKAMIAEAKGIDFGKLEDEFAEQLREVALQRSRQTDPRIVRALDFETMEIRTLLDTLKIAKPRMPELTFSDRLVLHGVQRNAEVLTYGGGHTSSDAIVYLPSEKVAFMGDLVLNHKHPWVGHGDITRWRSILERVSLLPIACVVPGHGDVCTAEAIEEITHYLVTLQEAARVYVERGDQPEFADRVPSPFDEWDFGHVYEWNIRHLVSKQ